MADGISTSWEIAAALCVTKIENWTTEEWNAATAESAKNRANGPTASRSPPTRSSQERKAAPQIALLHSRPSIALNSPGARWNKGTRPPEPWAIKLILWDFGDALADKRWMLAPMVGSPDWPKLYRERGGQRRARPPLEHGRDLDTGSRSRACRRTGSRGRRRHRAHEGVFKAGSLLLKGNGIHRGMRRASGHRQGKSRHLHQCRGARVSGGSAGRSDRYLLAARHRGEVCAVRMRD